MANKAANIDFGQSINRMNRMTSEKPRTEQTQEGGREVRNEERPTESQRPLVITPEAGKYLVASTAESQAKPTEDEQYKVSPTLIDTDLILQPRRGPGRKKRDNNIRTNPKTIFFDDDTDYALSTIKLNNSIDKKDLVLAATRLFLEKYYQSDIGRLSEDGVSAIFQQISGHK